jgi:uncharacterized coiled-coil protein SlyX
MDSRFLTFLGQYFLSAARNQELLTQLQAWTGFPSRSQSEFGDLFRKAYGLGPPPAEKPGEKTEQAAAWQKALESYQASLAGWYEMMAVVPLSQYRALEQKAEALEEKVAEQARTLQRLRQTGSTDPGAPGAAADALAELMKKQADAFQELMRKTTESLSSGE